MGLRRAGKVGVGERIWQPDFLWLYPRLSNLQCSVCLNGNDPSTQRHGVRKSKPHAPRKRGKGWWERKAKGKPVLLATVFFFPGELSSFCSLTSKSPPQPCLSHHPSAAELIKHQMVYQFCLVRVWLTRGLTRERFACFNNSLRNFLTPHKLLNATNSSCNCRHLQVAEPTQTNPTVMALGRHIPEDSRVNALMHNSELTIKTRLSCCVCPP